MSLVPYLSASSCEVFRNCPRRFYFEKIEKRPKSPAGWQAHVGTVVHSTLENLMGLEPELRTPEKSVEIMSTVWNDFKGSKDYMFLEIPDSQFKHAVFNAVRVYESLHDVEGINVVSLERELSAEVEGVPVFGFVDQVVSSKGWVSIIDVMTGRTPKEADYSKKLFQPLELKSK